MRAFTIDNVMTFIFVAVGISRRLVRFARIQPKRLQIYRCFYGLLSTDLRSFIGRISGRNHRTFNSRQCHLRGNRQRGSCTSKRTAADGARCGDVLPPTRTTGLVAGRHCAAGGKAQTRFLNILLCPSVRFMVIGRNRWEGGSNDRGHSF